MAEGSTPAPGGDDPRSIDADERMREAKRVIDQFVAELDARAGVPPPAASGPAPPGQEGRPPPGVAPTPELPRREPAAGEPASESFDQALERRVHVEAAAIESRLAEWIGERVRAAERRLELQSEALETALRGDAALADRSGSELEAVREELRAAHGDALARIEQLRAELLAGSGAADAEAYVAQGRDRVAVQVDAWVAERVEGALAEQLALLTTELRTEAISAVEEAAGQAGVGLQTRATELEAEVSELREDLSKRGIKRHRQRLDDDHERLLAEARTTLQQEAERLNTWLGSTARVAEAGAESRLQTLVGEAEASLARVRETLGEQFRRLAWETGEEFERRVEQRFTILERELLMTVEAAEAAAGQRLAEVVEDAGARLRAVDSAQERELRIRDRVQRAREQAERRVREAERRLAEVLDGLEGSER
jgi:hypothetical protein